MHEFATIAVCLRCDGYRAQPEEGQVQGHSREPQTLLLSGEQGGGVTAADIQLNQNLELVNRTSSSALSTRRKVRDGA